MPSVSALRNDAAAGPLDRSSDKKGGENASAVVGLGRGIGPRFIPRASFPALGHFFENLHQYDVGLDPLRLGFEVHQ